VLPYVVLTLFGITQAVAVDSPGFFLVFLAATLLIFWWYRRLWRFLVRMVWAVRRFHTVRDGRIVLHYAPELHGWYDAPRLLEHLHEELDRLVEPFGHPLRGRVVVFLFACWTDLEGVYGTPCGGFALVEANAIVLAVNTNLRESMRHELAHLFSGQWNKDAPPLLSEGLSMWLQETEWGQPIDTAARRVLGDSNLPLVKLLDRKFFFSEPHRLSCYLLSGSFTGYLIRRYGWQPYRKLFFASNGLRFRAKFERCFGVSLENAERNWRREQILLGVVNRRLRRSIRF
jgi:hypothetical protein